MHLAFGGLLIVKEYDGRQSKSHIVLVRAGYLSDDRASEWNRVSRDRGLKRSNGPVFGKVEHRIGIAICDQQRVPTC